MRWCCVKKVFRRRTASRRRVRTRGLAIGLTGGIACGKSEVARVLAELGADVADADEYAHEALRPRTRAYRDVVRLFGRSVVRRDGTLDRRAVARRVVADAPLRAALEKIVHPVVIRRLARWVKQTVAAGRNAVAVVPLLFEVGMTGPWDAVICVSAPRSQILKRLESRGLDRAEARAWMRAQMPVAEKERRADYVIRNDGALADLKRKTEKIWERVLKRGVRQS
jgi:dephospho-CoA kinase